MTTTTRPLHEDDPTVLLRAIGYRRVSTESQLDGFGLELQDDALRLVADELGAQLVAVYTDEGICGAEGLEVRRALASALDDLAEHPGTILLVPRLDRLARDLMVQEQVLADAWKTGASVVPCAPSERIYCQPDTPEDPARTLIRQMLGAVAAYERAMIRLRLVRGRRRRLEETRWAGGPTPFGWADPTEQATLAYCDEQRAAGVSYRRLAADLNARGMTKRNGGTWAGPELHRMMSRREQWSEEAAS